MGASGVGGAGAGGAGEVSWKTQRVDEVVICEIRQINVC
jgi:hypothetical protein